MGRNELLELVLCSYQSNGAYMNPYVKRALIALPIVAVLLVLILVLYYFQLFGLWWYGSWWMVARLIAVLYSIPLLGFAFLYIIGE